MSRNKQEKLGEIEIKTTRKTKTARPTIKIGGRQYSSPDGYGSDSAVNDLARTSSVRERWSV